jgi:hypothetical protein
MDLQVLSENEQKRAFRIMMGDIEPTDKLALSGEPMEIPKVEISLSDLDMPSNVIRLTEIAKQNFSELDATFEEAIAAYGELDTLKVREIQLAAYYSGLYGETPAELIRWGDKTDPIALQQWQNSVEQALLSTTTGQNLTPRNIITNIKERGRVAQERHFKMQEDMILNMPLTADIKLDDPNVLYKQALQIGQSLLGRAPSEADLKHIISTIHGQQKQQQMAKARADLDAAKMEAMNKLQLERLEFETMLENAQPEALTNPFAAADAGSLLGITPPTAQDRIAEIQRMQSQQPNITTEYSVDPVATSEAWLHKRYGDEIEIESLREMLEALPMMLRSPNSGNA